MKLAHAVKFRVIASPEREEAVKESVLTLLGIPLDEVYEEEDVEFDVDEAEDFSGDELRFIRTSFTKTRNTNRVIESLQDGLSQGDREMLAGQPDRFDEELNFHVRLDLDSFLDGAYIVTEDGDCVHIRIKVAAYPAKKEKAKDVVKEILGVQE